MPIHTLPVKPLTPWRQLPSQTVKTDSPSSQSIYIADAWPTTLNSAERGTALHLALAACLTRPDLAFRIAQATGLPSDTIEPIKARAIALKNWLAEQGFPDLACEVPILGHTLDGAEIPGSIDLMARGPTGCLIVDHKSGGSGKGLGSYWGQLSAYAALIPTIFPEHPIRGVAIHWMDHGTLEFVDFSTVTSLTSA